MKRKLCILLILLGLFQFQQKIVFAETISKGVDYTNRQDHSSGFPQTIQQITVQPNPGNRWMTVKGRDHVLATESVPSQVNRKIASGNRVVAAVNADMYKVASGLPIGLQIQQNEVLVSHSVKESALKFPSFVVNGQGKPELGSYGVIGTLKSPLHALTIHSVNRNENLDNRVGIFTNAHHLSKTINFTGLSDAVKKEVAIVTLKGDSIKSFKLGRFYTWEVDQVTTTFRSNIPIPTNGVVLVAFGKQKKPLLELVKEKNVTTQMNLIQMSNLQVRNDIEEAVSGYNWLIKDGIGLDLNALSENHDRFLMIARKARTLIGLTANQTVHILTVDQGRTTSTGFTMLEAVAQMKRLGAVSALAFDGGGSTEMMVRRAGEFPVRTVNMPADGRSRSVTNSLMITTRYVPEKQAAYMIIPEQPELYVGETRQLMVKLTDKNSQPIDVNQKNITLSGPGAYGMKVQAPLQPGKWTGKLAVDKISRSVTINVTNRLSGMTLNAGQPLLLKVGQKVRLTSEGWLSGRKISIPSTEKKYSLKEPIATISKDILTAKKVGKAVVTLKAGGQTVSLPLTIVPTKPSKSIVLDSFENDSYISKSPYVSSYSTMLSTEQKSAGRSALKLTYDYSGWTKQNGAMYITNPKWRITAPATSLSLDVYGDRKAPWLRAQLKDAKGNIHTIDFAKRIDWTGFKTIQAKIDPTWPVPLQIQSLYFVETDIKKKGMSIKSSVYLDQLKVWN
ncbi:phosphodiester glycosidase family protein [Exiguobacterium undae]